MDKGLNTVRIGIVGGGAAGMMAAITAARCGAQVTLFERGERVGKKILATGNGKCNLGNTDMDENAYYGSSPEWIRSCLECFTTEDAVTFFNGIGLLVKNKGGYLYPASEQAAVVLDVLRNELSAVGVEVITECKINAIEVSEEASFMLSDGKRKYYFDKVILSCGGKAAPKTGSDGSGYKLAAKLKHPMIPCVPALVQLKCREDYLKAVAGVRCEGVVKVFDQGNCIAVERGEIQLTEYGVSGIPVFQLSRKVNYLLRNQTEVTVELDLLPDFEEENYARLQATRALLQNGRTVEEFFTGLLHKKIMLLFVKMAGLKPKEAIETADKSGIMAVYELCRSWRLHINGSNSYDSAQVCAGGVDTAQVTSRMESKLIPGLFFAGELLDVDGRCGGYNLHWAWCSGYIAGREAAK